MMKKLIIVGVVSLVLMLASACNTHTCPAYSQADAVNTEMAG